MEKAKTEKKTSRTGRKIGTKKRARVSIAVNDADRAVSRLWETVKGFYSKKKETAAETARRVILNGLMMELEQIMLLRDSENRAEQDRRQMKLFDE